jgi:aminopeptidase-like protein
MIDLTQLVSASEHLGQPMADLMAQLFPVCRSLTGRGVVATLERLRDHIPLLINQVPSGTKALDWEVPLEWNVEDAYIKNGRGVKVVDFHKSNLHLVSYSQPVRTHLSLSELSPHLFSRPDQPNAIPYRTAYYDKSWGFCLADSDLRSLPEDTYEVVIESTLTAGHLSYGELVIPGEVEQEVLISTHVCHPSMANDNLSGIVIATHLAKLLLQAAPYYTYRFLFVPVTIGAIAWLSQHESILPRVKHGLVLTGLGDAGRPTYKRSRRAVAEVDQAMEHILRTTHEHYEVRDFNPFGYDERQYCSPGFDLAVGCLMRTPHGEYPEYHTSLDNLDFVKPESLQDSLTICAHLAGVLDNNATYENLWPHGEPQLGRRGLYQAMAQQTGEQKKLQLAMLWLLNYSDGRNSLLDICRRSGLPFSVLTAAAALLVEHQLLKHMRANHQ